MNCYDFDQTIFFPDSSYCFVMYCLRRFPRAVLSALPGTALSGCGKLLQLSDTRALKEQVFSFLPLLDDVDGIVEEFWDRHFDAGIASWYLRQKRPDDLIVSASFTSDPGRTYPVRIKITAIDRYHLLHDIIDCFTEERHLSMDKIGTVTQDQIVDCLIDFQVHSADELYDTMNSIAAIPGVDEVQRISL